jgi:DNA mismatch endonuclease, patch repair protein
LADVLTPQQRRLNMSRIKGKNTKPELMLRRALHAQGFRFRLHHKDLPGRPDLVFPRYRAVILVHGCFWHGHGCPLSKMPATRPDFWATKIGRNRDRDRRVLEGLYASGWRTLVVWECALRGAARLGVENVLEQCAQFVQGQDRNSASLEGMWRIRGSERQAINA